MNTFKLFTVYIDQIEPHQSKQRFNGHEKEVALTRPKTRNQFYVLVYVTYPPPSKLCFICWFVIYRQTTSDSGF